ncbi:MAG: hypothetical protein ACJ74O_20735 [Frankiaceae bacterium]
MSDDLETLLRNGLAGGMLDDAPALRDLAGGVRRRHRQRRTAALTALLSSAAIAAAVALVTPWSGALGGLAGLGGRGRTITVDGALVHRSDHLALCLPAPFLAVGSGRGGRHVDCLGEVALGHVPASFRLPAGPAEVRVVGRYDGRTVRVRTIELVPTRTGPEWADPPCDPPPGGWARTHDDASATSQAVYDYDATNPSWVVAISQARPEPGVTVVIVATTDVAQTERDLGAYARTLCVVASRYTRAQFQSTTHAMQGLMARWPGPYGIYEAGSSVRPDGQPVVQVKVVHDSARLRRVVSRQPAGLVDVQPWLPW